MQRQPASLPLNPFFPLEQPPTDPLLLDTPLHRAVRQGSEETVKQLLKAGANPLAGADSSKGTPLFQAARLERKEMVKLLSEDPIHLEQAILNAISLCEHKKTQPNISDEACKTIGLLLQHKKKEVPFQRGGLLIYLALKKNNQALANLLHAYGAEATFAICEAASYNDVDILPTLIQGKEERANSKNANQLSALYLAAKHGHEQAIQQLIDLKADLNTAMLDAAASGDEQAIEWLLKKKGDVNAYNQTWESALYLAAANNHSKVVEQLAKNGANIHFPCMRKFTPLHVAAQNGHVDIVKQLLELKAEIHSLTEHNTTPLYLAAQYGHAPVVVLLINAAREQKVGLMPGTSPLLVTPPHPLKAAISCGHPDIVGILLHEIPKEALDLRAILDDEISFPALHIAAIVGYASIVDLLLNAQADINQREVGSDTALTLASRNGHTDVVELLLYRKAAVHRKNEYERSPLPVAAEKGHLKIVQALLREKLPEEEKKEVKSVVEMAAKKPEDKTINFFYEDYKNALLSAIKHEHPLVLRELLDVPLRLDLKQSACQGLLEYAIQESSAEIIAELLQFELKEQDVLLTKLKDLHAVRIAMEYERPLPVITILVDHPLGQQLLGNDGYSLLRYAATKGYSAIVKKLLPTEWKMTDTYAQQGYYEAFSLAKQYDHSSLIMELVNHPLSQALPLDEQLFALQHAATAGHEEIVKKLLPAAFKIIDVHTQKRYQQIVLQTAHNGHAFILKLLLQYEDRWRLLSPENWLQIIKVATNHANVDILEHVLRYTIRQFLIVETWYDVLEFAIHNDQPNIADMILKATEQTIQSFQARAKLCQHPLLADKAPPLYALLASTGRLLEMADKQNLIDAIETLTNKIDQLDPHIVEVRHDDVYPFIWEVNSQVTYELISYSSPSINLNHVMKCLLTDMKKIALSEEGKAIIQMRRYYTNLLNDAVDHRHGLGVKMLLGCLLGQGKMTPAYFKQQLLIAAQHIDIDTAQALIQYGQSQCFQETWAKALPQLLTEVLVISLENRDTDKDEDEEEEDCENDKSPEDIADKKAKLVDLLLVYNADPHATNPQGENALLLAVDDAQSNEKTVQALLRFKAKPNTFGAPGRNAFFVAVELNQPKIVELLLTNRADPNLTEKNGRSVLAMAVEKRRAAIVSRLLGAKANPNIKDENGKNILAVAAEKSETGIVSLLLRARANPNSCEQNGRNVLAVAIKNGYKEIVHHLLHAKANPNIKDEEGKSVLVVATAKEDMEIARLLLTFKANPAIKVAETSQVPAQETGPSHFKVVQMLLKADRVNTQRAENQMKKGMNPTYPEGIVETPLTEPGTQLKIPGKPLMEGMIEENQQLKHQLLITQTQLLIAKTQLLKTLKRKKRSIETTLAQEKSLLSTQARPEKRKLPESKGKATAAKKRK